MHTVMDGLYRATVNESISRVLIGNGYKRSSSTWRKWSGDICHMASVQRSQWNHEELISFTINLGIYVRGFVPLVYPLPEPTNPSVIDCCMQCRLSMLSPERCDTWWEFRPVSDRSDASKSVVEITDLLETYGLSFFDRFSSLETIVNYLRSPRSRSEPTIWPEGEVHARETAAVLTYLYNGADDGCSELQRLVDEHPRDARTRITAEIHQKLCKLSTD